MSKPTLIRITLFLVPAACLAALAFWWLSDARDPAGWPDDRADLLRRAVLIPAGEHPVGSREPGCYEPRRAALDAFYIWPVEVPASWWSRFRDAPLENDGNKPAAYVSHDDAQAFCAWMSEVFGVRVRLPTVDEWQVAARAGTPGVTYPWGWADPVGRAVFDSASISSIGSHEPNPWGLYDMSGNVAEWCRAPDGSDKAPVMGGSWAERSKRMLRISHRMMLPTTYRDADTGFRIVIESDPSRVNR